MKKRILSLFVLLSFVGGMANAYDADGNANKKREIDGAAPYVAYREYQLVRFASNGNSAVVLSAGDVVVGDCVSDDGVTVAQSSAANSVDAVRGVVVSTTIPTCDVTGSTAQTDYGRRNWGYVQVKGLCTTVNLLTGVLAGSSVVVAPLAKYGQAAVNSNSGQKTLGFAYDASANGNANEVYIDL